MNKAHHAIDEVLTPDELLAAALKMEQFGGSFASHIAKAYIHADGSNKAKLLEAFGDLFLKYHQF